MKYIVFIAVSFLLIACNTKYNVIDTGLANGKFDGNMYEYLHSNRYDWDSVRLMIEKADLVDLFEGKRAGYEQITFFGPTNHSVRRYMLENDYSSVAEMDKEFCYEMVMKCVVKGKHMRDDIPRGKPLPNKNDNSDEDWGDSNEDWENPDEDWDDSDEDWSDSDEDLENPDGDWDGEENEPLPGDEENVQGSEGSVFTGEMGNRFWIYSFQESYKEVAGVGAVVLFIVSLETQTKIDVASTNIEPTNGVVHSLHYNFTLGDF